MNTNHKPTVVDNYEKIADWFDEHRSKDLMEREYLEFMLKYLPPYGSILDLGCGTGEHMAQFFIERGHHVTGVDGSQKMIDYCQKRFPSMNWILQDMRTVDLSTRFDLVLTWNSFFHLNQEDQRAMFDIFEKHMKPSGILVFTSGADEGEEWGQMDGHDFLSRFLEHNRVCVFIERTSFQRLAPSHRGPQLWRTYSLGCSIIP